jgi:hypothetical protein
MNAEMWAVLGTTVATLVFLILPAVVYAYYVLEHWIDDRETYSIVMATVERRRQPVGDEIPR